MTSGFGVDKGADGSGTSAADIRKIYGGLFDSAGLVSLPTVTRSGSAMTYVIGSGGVAAINVGSGEILPAPIPTGTITASLGGSSPRTDIIYAQQQYPSIEGNANMKIGVATTLPARAVVIAKYTVPANATNSNAAVFAGGVDYAIPYGASLGILHKYVDTTVGDLPTALTRKGQGTISVPTDRRLKYSLTTTIQAKGAVGFDNAKYCEWGFIPNLDGADFILWSTPGLHQSLNTLYFEAYIDASAGTHTVNYGATRIVGPGVAYHFAGVLGGYGRVGTIFQVEDAGPIV